MNRPYALTMVSVAGCQPFAAMLADEHVIALQAFVDPDGPAIPLIFPQTVRALLEQWDWNRPLLTRARACLDEGRHTARLRAQALPAAAVHYHPPVDNPRQVFCTGANYRQHVITLMLGDPDMRGVGHENVQDPGELRRRAEATMDERANGGMPYCFLRLPTTLAAPQGELILPAGVAKPDWELELAVIIGRTARNVAASESFDHIAGYAIINDVTAREQVFRKDLPAMGADWLLGKSRPGFAPFGPHLVPAEFVSDPYALNIRLSVNGRLMQDETTRDMVIGIDRQIEYLSRLATLYPGDVIATGSPAGNGSHHGVFLAPGDVMEGSISGLGEQRIVCRAEQAG